MAQKAEREAAEKARLNASASPISDTEGSEPAERPVRKENTLNDRVLSLGDRVEMINTKDGDVGRATVAMTDNYSAVIEQASRLSNVVSEKQAPRTPKPPSTNKPASISQRGGTVRASEVEHFIAPSIEACESEQNGVGEIPLTGAVDNHNMAPVESLDEYVQLTLVPCRICGRKFNEERLEKHMTACVKANNANKSRKTFDMKKARVEGTEAAQFAKAADKVAKKYEQKAKKSNWKAKSEAFRATMRAAKDPNATPAPVVENPDFVKCPHCGRSFNESAAERHIPKCNSRNANNQPKNIRGRKPIKYDPRGRK